MYEGKSVLLIQLESFEQCVLGQRINGKEITPTDGEKRIFILLHENIRSGEIG